MQQDKQYLEEDDHSSVEHEENEENSREGEVDFSSLDRHELYQKIREMGEEEDIFSVRTSFEKAVAAYKAIMEEELQSGREKYVAEGGVPEEFVGVKNELDDKVIEADKAFHKKLYELRKKKENEQQENLKTRLQLIEELKSLSEEAGDMSLRFQQWHDIQNKWRNAGSVPSTSRSEVYNNYRHYNNLFFSQVQLSREFRELDLKKNVELRNELIKEAEALKENVEIGKALREYKRLSQRWKDTGPVPAEEKDELWNRFRQAGDVLFEKRKQALVDREKQKEVNLEKKKALVEKMKELTIDVPQDFKGLTDCLNKSEALFTEWKGIGYVPESDNGKTWKEFRNLRSVLFRERDSFYANRREVFQKNLAKKTELCEQAEALKDNQDWQETARKLKRLQDEWKKTGPVSKKHSDKIWKRFRSACDAFFNSREAAKGAKEQELQANVAVKQEFLDSLNTVTLSGEPREMLNQVGELKKKWEELGQVPHAERKNLDKAFEERMNAFYGQIKEETKEDPKLFQTLEYEQILSTPQGEQKLLKEKRNIQDKIKKLEAEIIQIENNLGFFRNSKGNPMVKEFEEKIEREKEELRNLKAKLKIMPV